MYNSCIKLIKRQQVISNAVVDIPTQAQECSLKDYILTIETIRNRNKFTVEQPFTPIRLMREITDQLGVDKTARVAVLFTVEWAVYLKAVGYTNTVIITETVDPIIQKICNILGIEYILLNTVMDAKMRFDAVVGNPPFQYGTNNKFYQEFIKVAFDLSSDVVAMITPSNWTSFASVDSSFLQLLEDNGLHTYKFLGDKAFNVQLLTVYFVASKLNNNGQVKLITTDDTITLDRDKLAYYPTTTTKALSIISNIKSLGLTGLTGCKGGLDRNKSIKDPNGVKCIFSAGPKGGDFDWAHVSSGHLTDNKIVGYNKHKVVVSRTTSIGKFGELKYAGPDYAVAQGAYYFEVNDSAEADNLITYLNSKIVRLIVRELKGAVCSNSQNVFKFIPKISLTKVWSDADLYAHFGLSKDEITYIEADVK
jgi:site-specific DNA-methyltransferase (adenine-specific)